MSDWKPSDVPQDVWDAAVIAVENMPTRPPFKADVHRAIAEAIIAEREACAQIADNGRYTTFMHWDPEGREPVTAPIPYREEIAVAIRNRSNPNKEAAA